MTYDPMASQFNNQPLPPWCKSKQMFDFDSGFVNFIQTYLRERKLVADVLAAKQWINKYKFEQERYELVLLQWSAYVEKRDRTSPVAGVAAEPVADVGIGAGDKRVDPAITPQQQAANLKRLSEMLRGIGNGGSRSEKNENRTEGAQCDHEDECDV